MRKKTLRPTDTPADEPVTYTIRYNGQYQLISVTPACPELNDLLRLRTITARDNVEHGYEVERRAEPLLAPDSGYAIGGLALVAGYRLLLAGHNVELQVSTIRRLPPPVPTPFLEPSNPHVVAFVSGNTHGRIVHGLGQQGLARLCVELTLAFPTARFAFIAPTKDLARHLCAAMRDVWGPVTLAFSNLCEHPDARIVVATTHGLAHLDVISNAPDVMMFTDAAAAIGENGQLAILANGRARLFGMLPLGQALPPHVSDLTMAAFGPEQVSVPQLGFQQRQVEVALVRAPGGGHVPDRLSRFVLRRRGIIFHNGRNACIAGLAAALATDNAEAVGNICPGARSVAKQTARRTAIVVREVEHGIALAQMLSDWPLITSQAVHLDGMQAHEPSILEAHRNMPLDGSCAIVTVAGLGSVNLSGFDIAVWAGGGTGLPEVPPGQLLCPAAEQHPLVWIDFRDHHHGELRRASSARRRAYEAAEWFPVGKQPVIGRIERFLAERPRS